MMKKVTPLLALSSGAYRKPSFNRCSNASPYEDGKANMHQRHLYTSMEISIDHLRKNRFQPNSSWLRSVTNEQCLISLSSVAHLSHCVQVWLFRLPKVFHVFSFYLAIMYSISIIHIQCLEVIFSRIFSLPAWITIISVFSQSSCSISLFPWTS